MRVIFLLCTLILFCRCETPEPVKHTHAVSRDTYRRFFAHAFGQVKRIDPRPLEREDHSIRNQLADSSLLAYFTPADIRFMRKQYASGLKSDLSDYFPGREFVGAKEADSLAALGFGEFDQPDKYGFDAFARPLFSADRLTVLVHHRHFAGNYSSRIKTAIYHWDGEEWREERLLKHVTW